MTVCNNCQFDANGKDAPFCSSCGAPLNAQANPATEHYQPSGSQQQPTANPVQYATAQPEVVQVVPTFWTNREYIVVPGQILTPTGYCVHAVQTNEFTWPGVLLGILFFPIGILCCLLLTERRCVHCGAILN
ncbi:Aste57867_22108 [Aphanomyces stellatus]|uniref:Membrane protein BRI3 n=1 Tax=Aphanomyces stellatus TaxID=120398 RepID=A0A485LKN4_9STRA|nr:hypothetical protein As57867_022039 [Aphanomyces stellatus]VFT98776.1 Aste57867_22108 [Aphanomyces stellatus]